MLRRLLPLLLLFPLASSAQEFKGLDFKIVDPLTNETGMLFQKTAMHGETYRIVASLQIDSWREGQRCWTPITLIYHDNVVATETCTGKWEFATGWDLKRTGREIGKLRNGIGWYKLTPQDAVGLHRLTKTAPWLKDK